MINSRRYNFLIFNHKCVRDWRSNMRMMHLDVLFSLLFWKFTAFIDRLGKFQVFYVMKLNESETKLSNKL